MKNEELNKKILEIKTILKEFRWKEKKKVGKISQKDFNNVHNEFEETEKRGSFYPLFTRLINQGDRLIAYLFILSTWNFAGFRYLINKFDVNEFNKSIDDLEPLFDKFKDENVRTINFDKFKKRIIEIYNLLSKQVKSVGATKIMHLRVPKVFILWDRRIREYYGFRDDSAENYIEFLKKMQKRFKNIELKKKNRTFAKAIDEYNYIRITQPLMNLEKELSILKKELKKYNNR